MTYGVFLPELNIEFDLSKVTFVHAFNEREPSGGSYKYLDVHFIGGEALCLPDWDMTRWQDMKSKLIFNLQLQNGK